MNEFLDMGGYAFYVWTSYALALFVLGLNWLLPRRALRQRRQALLRRARPAAAVATASTADVIAKEVTA